MIADECEQMINKMRLRKRDVIMSIPLAIRWEFIRMKRAFRVVDESGPYYLAEANGTVVTMAMGPPDQAGQVLCASESKVWTYKILKLHEAVAEGWADSDVFDLRGWTPDLDVDCLIEKPTPEHFAFWDYEEALMRDAARKAYLNDWATEDEHQINNEI